MAEQLTRTGSIREGFEYQDLYGVAVLIEWLEHPERYEWVAFEEDEFGFLDDVVRCTPQLELTLSQVKHSGVQETSRVDISLSELLDRPKGIKGPKDSLLQKWFKSWVGAMQQQRFSDVRAELLTNRTASDGLLSLTKKDSGTGLIDWLVCSARHVVAGRGSYLTHAETVKGPSIRTASQRAPELLMAVSEVSLPFVGLSRCKILHCAAIPRHPPRTGILTMAALGS